LIKDWFDKGNVVLNEASILMPDSLTKRPTDYTEKREATIIDLSSEKIIHLPEPGKTIQEHTDRHGLHVVKAASGLLMQIKLLQSE